jgi:hypothetical protein
MGSSNGAIEGGMTPPVKDGMGDDQRRVGAGRLWSKRAADSAERLDRLEVELKAMLKEIESLRAERQTAPSTAEPRGDLAPPK